MASAVSTLRLLVLSASLTFVCVSLDSSVESKTLARNNIQFNGFVPHKCLEYFDMADLPSTMERWEPMLTLLSPGTQNTNATKRLLELDSNSKIVTLKCLNY